MNKIFKVVFCKSTGTFVAVSENSKSHKKNTKSSKMCGIGKAVGIVLSTLLTQQAIASTSVIQGDTNLNTSEYYTSIFGIDNKVIPLLNGDEINSIEIAQNHTLVAGNLNTSSGRNNTLLGAANITLGNDSTSIGGTNFSEGNNNLTLSTTRSSTNNNASDPMIALYLSKVSKVYDELEVLSQLVIQESNLSKAELEANLLKLQTDGVISLNTYEAILAKGITRQIAAMQATVSLGENGASLYNNTVGDANIALGDANYTGGNMNTTTGTYNKTSGSHNTVNGLGNELTGDGSVVLGLNNISNGNENIVIGSQYSNQLPEITAKYSEIVDRFLNKSITAEQYKAEIETFIREVGLMNSEVNLIQGNNNTVLGKVNLVDGSSNQLIGSNGFISGKFNALVGEKLKVTGDYNSAIGSHTSVKGIGNTVNAQGLSGFTTQSVQSDATTNFFASMSQNGSVASMYQALQNKSLYQDVIAEYINAETGSNLQFDNEVLYDTVFGGGSLLQQSDLYAAYQALTPEQIAELEVIAQERMTSFDAEYSVLIQEAQQRAADTGVTEYEAFVAVLEENGKLSALIDMQDVYVSTIAKESTVVGDHVVGLGAGITVNADDAVAIGKEATVSHDGSVALGAGSTATGATLPNDAYLVGGTATAEVNIGDRRITGLAAGAENTDAVNVAQLTNVNDRVVENAENITALGDAIGDISLEGLSQDSWFFIAGKENIYSQPKDEKNHASTVLGSANDITFSSSSSTDLSNLVGHQNNLDKATNYSLLGNRNTVSETAHTHIFANDSEISNVISSVVIGSKNKAIAENGRIYDALLIGGNNQITSDANSSISNGVTLIGSDNKVTGNSQQISVLGAANIVDNNVQSIVIGTANKLQDYDNKTQVSIFSNTPVANSVIGSNVSIKGSSNTAIGTLISVDGSSNTLSGGTFSVNGTSNFANIVADMGVAAQKLADQTDNSSSKQFYLDIVDLYKKKNNKEISKSEYNAALQAYRAANPTDFQALSSLVGTSNVVNGSYNIATGAQIGVEGDNNIVFGSGINIKGNDSVAIGQNTQVATDGSVALGANSNADGTTLNNEAFLIGGTATAEVNIGDRRITGLVAGAENTDAVNVAQLKEVSAAVEGITLKDLSSDSWHIEMGKNNSIAQLVDDKVNASTVIGSANSVTNPKDEMYSSTQQLNILGHGNSTDNSVAYNLIGSHNRLNGSSSVNVLGENNSITNAEATNVLGNGNSVAGTYNFANTVTGQSNKVLNNSGSLVAGLNNTVGISGGGNAMINSVVGSMLNVQGTANNVFGYMANTKGSFNVSFNSLNTIHALDDLIAVEQEPTKKALLQEYRDLTILNMDGKLSPEEYQEQFSDLLARDPENSIVTALTPYLTNLPKTEGNYNVVMGSNNHVIGDGNLALGSGLVVEGDNRIALGNNTKVDTDGSVALGLDSYATGLTLNNEAYLVGGTASAEVNIGNRRITGLSAGSENTDAVNVEQLKSLAQNVENSVSTLNDRINLTDQNLVQYQTANDQKVNDLEAGLSTTNQTIDQNKADNDAQFGEIQTGLNTTNNTVAQNKIDADQKASQLDAGLQSANGQLIDLSAGLASTNDKVGKLETGLAETNVKVGELEAGLADTNSQLGQTNDKIDQIQALNDAKFGDLETGLASTNDKVGKLETGLADTNAKVDQNQALNDAKFGELETDLASTNDKVVELQTGLADTNNQLGLTNDKIDQNQALNDAKIGDIETGLASTNDKVGEIETGLVDTNAKVDQNQATNDAKFGELENDLASTNDKVGELETDLADTNQSLETLKTETNTQIGNLDSELDKTQNDLQTAIENSVKYGQKDGDVDYSAVVLQGEDGSRITNLANGEQDSDAVNLGQVKNLIDSIGPGALSGNTIQYDLNADGTVNKDSVVLGGESGTLITNVQEGKVEAGSTDAINGSQLNAVYSNLSSSLGGGASWNAETSTYTAPVYELSTGSYKGVDSALTALDAKDQALEGKINNLEQSFANQLNATDQNIRKVEKRLSAGIAQALSMESAPYVAGKLSYALGAAHYNGEQAIGGTLRLTAENGNWSVITGVSGASEGGAAFKVGMSGVFD